MTNVQVRIIGVHERDAIIAEMLKSLGETSEIVFYDPIKSKNCLARTIKVLKQTDQQLYSHVAVLCDDLELVDNFKELLTLTCEMFPDAIINPYNSRIDYKDKKKASPYVCVNGCGTYGQAIVFPTKYIDQFIAWVDTHCPPDYVHDDVATGEFAYQNGIKIITTIPSLVQHIEPTNSILKYNNPNKISKVYEGKLGPLSYNWATKEYSVSKVIRNSGGMVAKIKPR